MLLALYYEMPESSCRPAGDALFRSTCRAWRAGYFSAVLTGIGPDRDRESEQLEGAGRYAIAPEEASSLALGMPVAVAQAGLADGILPLGDNVPATLRQVGQ